MDVNKRKGMKIIGVIFFSFMILGLLACSQEAKKERHWKRGEKYFSENNFREAIIEYKNVVQIEPTFAQARYKLGLAHLRVGQFREAYLEFLKTIELDPNMLDARLHLGNI